MTKNKIPKKRLKESDGEDFFLYNTDQDTREIIEGLSLGVASGRGNLLDNKRSGGYDSEDYNELY